MAGRAIAVRSIVAVPDTFPLAMYFGEPGRVGGMPIAIGDNSPGGR